MRVLIYAFLCLFSGNAFASMNFVENCGDISGWTDADSGTTAESTQFTFVDESTFKFSVPTAGSGRVAQRNKDQGSSFFPKTYIVVARIYNSSIGTIAAGDYFALGFYRTASGTGGHVPVYFGSNGLFSWVSSNFSQIGSDGAICDTGVWNVWKFYIDTSAATGTIRAYKNGVFYATKTGITYGSGTAGRTRIQQVGETLNGVLTYIDYLRIYSEDGNLIYSMEG